VLVVKVMVGFQVNQMTHHLMVEILHSILSLLMVEVVEDMVIVVLVEQVVLVEDLLKELLLLLVLEQQIKDSLEAVVLT
jgi:hypothetical protein